MYDRACGGGLDVCTQHTKKITIFNVVRLVAATPRASGAIMPPQIEKSLSANLVRGERPLDGDEVHYGVTLWHKYSSTS